MTVFVVWFADHDDSGILGVFSTMSLAKDAKALYNLELDRIEDHSIFIDEIQVDQLHV